MVDMQSVNTKGKLRQKE